MKYLQSRQPLTALEQLRSIATGCICLVIVVGWWCPCACLSAFHPGTILGYLCCRRVCSTLTTGPRGASGIARGRGRGGEGEREGVGLMGFHHPLKSSRLYNSIIYTCIFTSLPPLCTPSHRHLNPPFLPSPHPAPDIYTWLRHCNKLSVY